MSFSQVQCIVIVEHYLHSPSYLKCQDDFRCAFPKSQVPDKSTVFHFVAHFHETVSVSNQKHCGCPKVFNFWMWKASDILKCNLHKILKHNEIFFNFNFFFYLGWVTSITLHNTLPQNNSACFSFSFYKTPFPFHNIVNCCSTSQANTNSSNAMSHSLKMLK